MILVSASVPWIWVLGLGIRTRAWKFVPDDGFPTWIQHQHSHGEIEESDKEPVEVEEHREHSDEEPDEYEELSVKSDEKYKNGGGGGSRIEPQESRF